MKTEIEEGIKEYIRKISSLDEFCKDWINEIKMKKENEMSKRRLGFNINSHPFYGKVLIKNMDNCELVTDKGYYEGELLIIDINKPAICRIYNPESWHSFTLQKIHGKLTMHNSTY